MIKIVDAFIFYNEIQLLLYRFHILYEIVDFFIIIESTHSFNGQSKPLYFNQNKHLFDIFKDKIIYFVVNDFPYIYPNIDISNYNENEFFQRNAIQKGVLDLNLEEDDCIIISDIQEIPNPDILLKIKKNEITLFSKKSLQMDVYFYTLRNKVANDWVFAKIISYKEYKKYSHCNDIRFSHVNEYVEIIPISGWNLTYFGDIYSIQDKMKSYLNEDSSIELNTINQAFIDVQQNDLNNDNLPYKYDQYLSLFYNIIKDKDNNIINTKNIELYEQEFANLYISEKDTVLELGARYGSVSCIINAKINKKPNQVSVEPDNRVWDALEENKKLNHCSFHIVKGFISNKKLDLTNLDDCYDGYGSTFIEKDDTTIPSYSLHEIQEKYNLQFNVLVADCEGFLEVFFDENPYFYDQLRLIIFEADYEYKCNYNKIRTTLVEKKFINIFEGHQNIWIKEII